MKRMRLIRQHDEKDCGAACLSMIFEFYGIKLPMAIIREDIQIDQYGASIYGIVNASSKYGLIGQALKGNPLDVWEVLLDISSTKPSILRVLNRNTYEHYIVALGTKNGKIHVFDPDNGKQLLTKEEFESIFLGQIIIFEVGSGFKKLNQKKGSISKFTNIIFRQKKLLLAIAILSLGITAIGLFGTFIFQYLIDKVIPQINSTTSTNDLINSFSILILLLFFLYIIRAIVQLLRGRLLTLMSKNIDLPLINGYYNHITELPMRFFDTRKTGEILSRFSDAEKIREAISDATLTIMIDCVLVIACGVVLYNASTILFIIAMASFGIYVIISVFYIRPLEKINRILMEQETQFNSFLKESVDGMETVKTCQAETSIRNKMHSLLSEYIKKDIFGSMLCLSKDTLIDFISSISSLALIWFGTISIAKGEMTIGSLVTYSSLLNYFLSPVENLVNLQGNIQQAIIAADRLNDFLDLKLEDPKGDSPEEHLYSLEMKNINFRYGTRSLILKNFELSISEGQHIALVGESGCGKSTIAKLIQQLYIPENGIIMVNEKPSSSISLNWIRKRIAFVSQRTFLFSDTIKNNLIIGIDEDKIPTDAEIIKILRLCECHFIEKMPMGLDSYLEENGVNLSGGQRQRLSIARALIRNPDFLILDEATSALDTITEQKILDAIKDYNPHMMVLMIAHRLSTICHCNKIIVLKDGVIAEVGNHTELLNLNGIYSSLWNKQYLQ